MSTIRIKKESNYSVISNTGLKDNNLSWGAVGLYAYLLSLPDDWEIKVEHLRKTHKDGISSTRAKMKELEDNGYLIKGNRIRKNGKLQGYEYTLYESSTLDFLKLKNKSRNSNLENLKIVSTNKPSTKLISTKKEVINSFPKENCKTTILKLNDSIEEVIKEIIPIGNFQNRLPKKNQSPNKTILKVQSYIQSIKNGNLAKDFKFDVKWREDRNIVIPNGELDSYDKIKKALSKASKRYVMMKKEGYWPENKQNMTRNMADWIYNPRTKKSWFLYCLNNKPIEIKEAIGCRLKEKLLEKDKWIVRVAEKHKPEWKDNPEYWEKVYKLWKWFDKYEDRICDESYCRDFGELLDRIKEYSETFPVWYLGNFGLGNKTWYRFCEWMDTNYKVKLNFKKVRTK